MVDKNCLQHAPSLKQCAMRFRKPPKLSINLRQTVNTFTYNIPCLQSTMWGGNEFYCGQCLLDTRLFKSTSIIVSARNRQRVGKWIKIHPGSYQHHYSASLSLSLALLLNTAEAANFTNSIKLIKYYIHPPRRLSITSIGWHWHSLLSLAQSKYQPAAAVARLQPRVQAGKDDDRNVGFVRKKRSAAAAKTTTCWAEIDRRQGDNLPQASLNQ